VNTRLTVAPPPFSSGGAELQRGFDSFRSPEAKAVNYRHPRTACTCAFVQRAQSLELLVVFEFTTSRGRQLNQLQLPDPRGVIHPLSVFYVSPQEIVEIRPE